MTRRPAKPVPGSAKVGAHDLRSTDLHGHQADAVASHSERASRDGKPKTKTPPASGEVEGAFRDQVGKG